LRIRWTSPSSGSVPYGGHLAKDSPDAAYWFGHVTTSSVRVFEWPDDSTTMNWHTVDVHSWKGDTFLYYSPTPASPNWLDFTFGLNAIRGATVVSTTTSAGNTTRTIKIAWGAGPSGGFTYPYVRLVDIARLEAPGLGTFWASGNEQQIWSTAIGYEYPYLATNSDGEVGIALACGGTHNIPTALTGFVGDNTLFRMQNSTFDRQRWGDWTTIRRHSPNSKLFAVSDYRLETTEGGYRVMHQYRLFGRSVNVGTTF
jgi:hypothetical protein